MVSSRNWDKILPWVVWACALTAIVVWALQPGYVVGWDLNVYRAALVSLRAGHDPYQDAMAIQRVYHAEGPHPAGTGVPFSYVYSPITLPVVRLAGHVPLAVTATIYWCLYIAAVLATLWAVWQAVERRERRGFALLLPLAVFFPGLLEQDVIFSGNIAFILYGAMLSAAVLGWRRGRWLPFYVVAVVASCFKAPLLIMVALPFFSARRERLPACVAGVVGVFLFAIQPHVWPALFRHYLEAVELQFSFNRDFSSSPAGLVANALFGRAPYQLISALAYLVYAIPLAVILFRVSRAFEAGELSLKQWAPVLLLGVILLNPRIMEYDVAPLALPMALVAWRFFADHATATRAWICLAILFAVVNTVAAHPFADTTWRPMEGILLLGVFAAGAHTLFRQRLNTVTIPAPMLAAQ